MVKYFGKLLRYLYDFVQRCNWQKVQLNTDLFSDTQKYLYTNQMVQLKDNLMCWIKKGEGFNLGKAELLAFLI
jgi:hypothetical protein